MKKILITLLAFGWAAASHANVIINTTRVIYPSADKEVSVQLFNKGQQPALVQAWIDDGAANSTPETADVPFTLMPPVSKVEAGGGQQLRIRATDPKLPRDRESVFYLNVLDIPPEPEQGSGNVMQIAIKSRIKLFYRPEGLTPAPEARLSKLAIVPDAQGLRLINRSPYFITLIGMKDARGQALIHESLMLAPLSERKITASADRRGGSLTLMTVDDFGAWNSQRVTATAQ